MRRMNRVACSALVMGLLGAFANARQSKPDLILLNGKIFTSDAAHPYVQALAIRGERILATGTTAQIEALAERRTKRIDLAWPNGHTGHQRRSQPPRNQPG